MTDAVRQPRAVVHLVAAVMATLLLFTTASAVDAGERRHKKLEHFAHRLVNCTRTGGWVLKDGSCRAYGSGSYSRYRPPLPFHQGIADEVAWPWARRLARADVCGHEIGTSDVDSRFASAGYRDPVNGESVGCSAYYRARRMIIFTFRLFQSEKEERGWHWRNLKDPDWRSVGIGVATVGRQRRVVYDFYGARPPSTASRSSTLL